MCINVTPVLNGYQKDTLVIIIDSGHFMQTQKQCRKLFWELSVCFLYYFRPVLSILCLYTKPYGVTTRL